MPDIECMDLTTKPLTEAPALEREPASGSSGLVECVRLFRAWRGAMRKWMTYEERGVKHLAREWESEMRRLEARYAEARALLSLSLIHI